MLLHSLLEISGFYNRIITGSQAHFRSNGFEHLILQKIISEYNIQTLPSSKLTQMKFISNRKVSIHSFKGRIAVIGWRIFDENYGIPVGKNLAVLRIGCIDYRLSEHNLVRKNGEFTMLFTMDSRQFRTMAQDDFPE